MEEWCAEEFGECLIELSRLFVWSKKKLLTLCMMDVYELQLDF